MKLFNKHKTNLSSNQSASQDLSAGDARSMSTQEVCAAGGNTNTSVINDLRGENVSVALDERVRIENISYLSSSYS